MAAAIRLRTSQFRKYTAIAGMPTDDAKAKAIKVDPATLSRVLKGRCAPGARFIAGTLAAFPDLDFEDLFEVVDDSDTEAVPA